MAGAPEPGPQQTLNRIRHAVCAVGFTTQPLDIFLNSLDPYPPFQVLGSGFLLRPEQDQRWGGPYVATCRHVVEALLETLEKYGLSFASAFLHFVYPEGGSPASQSFRRFEIKTVLPVDVADIAFLRIQPPDGFPALPAPLTVMKVTDQVVVGEEIGLVGYPHGNVLLEDRDRKARGEALRIGPVLQRGYVSALSPHDVPNPDDIVLNIVTAGGASGSPVFRIRTGEIIGVLARGIMATNSSIAMAVPLVDRGDGFISVREPYKAPQIAIVPPEPQPPASGTPPIA